MATATTTYDVFLSHSSADREVAAEIARRLESAGLRAFYDECVEPGTDLSAAIWDALAECRALIAVVSIHTTPDAMGMVEIGAAIAWNKPIYPILTGPSSTRLPDALKSYHAYPQNRLDEVIQKIRTDFEPLSDHDREVLTDLYHETDLSADQISQSTKSLRDLTTRFNRKTQKQLSGERLLSELLRLRKKGALPRRRG
ncbi:MAG: toll/interleukin-1 receptor domain-containing protein [Thermoguttaceae bacterium]